MLNEEDGSYRYKGEVDDNYIYYSGMYFRILEIDKDGNIKAISEDNVTLMYSGFEKGYEKSYVNKWLNVSEADYSGVYEKALKNPDEFLVSSYYCSDVVDSTESITCDENANNYKITLLSLYDYKEAGGKTSFINNYWCGSINNWFSWSNLCIL